MMTSQPQEFTARLSKKGDLWPLLLEEMPDGILEQNRQYETRLGEGLEETIQVVSPEVDLRDEYAGSLLAQIATLKLWYLRSLCVPARPFG